MTRRRKRKRFNPAVLMKLMGQKLVLRLGVSRSDTRAMKGVLRRKGLPAGAHSCGLPSRTRPRKKRASTTTNRPPSERRKVDLCTVSKAFGEPPRLSGGFYQERPLSSYVAAARGARTGRATVPYPPCTCGGGTRLFARGSSLLCETPSVHCVDAAACRRRRLCSCR